MIPLFDIFRVETEGNLKWQAVTEALNVATLKIKTLMDELPGDYVICSQRTGHKMVVKAMVRSSGLALLEKISKHGSYG